MSAMTDIAALNAIDLAATLRPQRFGSHSTRGIRDPLIEPAWAGVRVIAGATADAAALFEDGESIPDYDEVVATLVRVGRSSGSGAILDGYLTKQATADPTGEVGEIALPSATTYLTQTLVGNRATRGRERLAEIQAEDAALEFAADDVVAFVAVDLLWLDDTWLLDIPLLERRRLLRSVVPGEEFVRCGPFVRPPISSWIGSWRAQGFTGLMFKEANGRYHPGEKAKDWATIPMPRR
jgi:hypothetical protein